MIRRLFALLALAAVVLACGSHEPPPGLAEDASVPSAHAKLGAVPTPVFPAGVDPPIQQDANFKIDKSYVSYVDSRTRAIETYVLNQSSAGSSDDQSKAIALPDTSYTISNSDWLYGTLLLQGTLTATRTVTAPTGVTTAPRKAVQNQTSQSIVFAPTGGGASVTIPAGSTVWVVFDGANFAESGGSTGPVDLRQSAQVYPAVADAGAGYYAVDILADGGANWTQLTTDLINALPAAFSVSLALASGGGTFEIGDPSGCAPTFNATPATNDSSVTGSTIADNQGHAASAISHANAINVDTPGGPHVYSLSSPGTVTVTVAETKIATSTTKSGSSNACTFDYRWFQGKDAHSGGNAITASTTNATLSGGSATATLTGALAANMVGVSFTISPSNEYVYMAFPHTGTPHVFHDQNGFVFDVGGAPVVSSFSYTTVTGVVGVLYDIYRSTNQLNTTYTVTVVSMNDALAPWADEPPANDVDARDEMPKSEAA